MSRNHMPSHKFHVANIQYLCTFYHILYMYTSKTRVRVREAKSLNVCKFNPSDRKWGFYSHQKNRQKCGRYQGGKDPKKHRMRKKEKSSS